jgi:methylamine---glutamate N-methyltransferase subunit A
VTTLGAHPFSTGPDQCLVHNGSLSNHNNLRRELLRQGMTFETENDSEVAAAYLTAEIARGKNLGEALTGAVNDLDGFFTFVVGDKSGFGVVRDAIACKPAVMAETDRYVSFGSEYRALAGLPDIDSARVWEPEPATVYFWDRNAPVR